MKLEITIFYLPSVTPLGRRVRMDGVSVRNFGSYHNAAVTTGNSLQKPRLDTVDYERGGS
jgi:hypothetical protein